MKYCRDGKVSEFILPLLFLKNNEIIFKNADERDIDIYEMGDAYDEDYDWDENTLRFMIDRGIIPIEYVWRH